MDARLKAAHDGWTLGGKRVAGPHLVLPRTRPAGASERDHPYIVERSAIRNAIWKHFGGLIYASQQKPAQAFSLCASRNNLVLVSLAPASPLASAQSPYPKRSARPCRASISPGN